MDNNQHKKLSVQAKELASNHNAKIAIDSIIDKKVVNNEKKVTYDVEKTVMELNPVLEKIFSMPSDNKKRITHLDVHPSSDKQYVNKNDLYNVVFDLQGHHIEYLIDEKFHVIYDPVDRSHMIRW